ncbi:MAG: hypothetical protein Q7R44_00600, partial [bacterium]|nr:hypothetical protein [bacterium]
IKRGHKPPACGNKKSCDSYCEDPNHMEECITFASEAGLMDNKEREDSQKMLQALKRGVKPPPCRGKQACDEYCQQPDNMEVCMSFAIEAGFMGDQEKENAQKMLSAVKKGVKPPNCRGKEECDSYCRNEEHFEECTNFAEAAGFMDSKDAEMARKTKGRGPGGCKGKEECESFCNNQSNQEICFKFAEENNMIPKEELEKMKEGMNQTREQRPMGPPNQNRLPPQREPREGEREPSFEGQMPPREQGPREFQRPPQEFNQSDRPFQPDSRGNFPPQPEFQGEQPQPEFERQLPPSDGQFQQLEPMPQIQQQPQEETAPPPLEPSPQLLLNNKYFGAIFRFLIND